MRARRRAPGAGALTATDGTEFDAVAEAYDRVRPGYPAQLVDATCARAGLGPGSRVLEVGCGTGKLTAALAERGLVVDAVDPGGRLLARARARVDARTVTFHLGRFEDVSLPENAYEAVFSGTAFHWIDPDVGWSKAARLLRPGGVLALLQTGLGGPVTELDHAILAAWREVLPAAAGWSYRDPFTLWDGVERRLGNVSEVWAWLTKHDVGRTEVAGMFAGVEVMGVPVVAAQRADDYLALLRTTSSYLRLPASARRRLESRIRAAFARAGGVLRRAELTTLVTARRA